MPIIKSAIKRVKQSEVRAARNLHIKRAVAKDMKAVLAAAASGNVKDAEKLLSAAYSQIDRAVKKGTLHKNTAARRKARLAAAISASAKSEAKPAAKKTAPKTKKVTKTTKK